MKLKAEKKQPNAMFIVELETGHKVLACIRQNQNQLYQNYSGRQGYAELLSPYDLTRGRITWRGKACVLVAIYRRRKKNESKSLP